MNVKNTGAALLAAIAFSLAAAPALAATTAEEEQAQARKDLERARQEVEKAREELQRATRDLARSLARAERDNPKAQYFEYMTDPKRAVLGVLIPDDVENGESRGVRVLAVTPGGGAEKAGLKAGDLLTGMNGAVLAADGKRSPQKKLREVLRSLKAGDEVKVEYERDGRARSTTLQTQPPEPDLAMAPLPMIQEWLHDPDSRMGPMSGMPWLHFRGGAIRGLELAKLDEDLGAYFKTRDGVLVVKAPKDGALGLKSGDVIQKIDGDNVSEPVTVLDKLRSRGEEQVVKLEIVRQGKRMEVQGKVPVADAQLPPPRPGRKRIEIQTQKDHEDGT